MVYREDAKLIDFAAAFAAGLIMSYLQLSDGMLQN